MGWPMLAFSLKGKVIVLLKKLISFHLKEKVNWIDDLSEERKRSIWEQHMACSQIRNSESFSVIKNVVK